VLIPPARKRSANEGLGVAPAHIVNALDAAIIGLRKLALPRAPFLSITPVYKRRANQIVTRGERDE
jgi:hypothetical protein